MRLVLALCLLAAPAFAAKAPSAIEKACAGKRQHIITCRDAKATRASPSIVIEGCAKGHEIASIWRPGPTDKSVLETTLEVKESHSTRPGAPANWAGTSFNLDIALTTAPNKDGSHMGVLNTKLGGLGKMNMSCK